MRTGQPHWTKVCAYSRHADVVIASAADESGYMSAKDAFAAIADDYDSWFETPLGSFIDRQELAALRSMIPPDTRGEILEIGAGTGHVAAFLAREGYRIVAVEPSAAMRKLGEAGTAELEITWVDAPGEELLFEDGRFGGAVFFATIEFVADQGAAFREALRVLQPGGWIAVGYLHPWSGWTALYRHRAEQGAEPWTAARFSGRDELEELAGFAAEASRGAVWLGPMAEEPFDEANEAGKRAGNAPAFDVLRWRKNP